MRRWRLLRQKSYFGGNIMRVIDQSRLNLLSTVFRSGQSSRLSPVKMLIDESVLDQKLNGIYQTISMNVGNAMWASLALFGVFRTGGSWGSVSVMLDTCAFRFGFESSRRSPSQINFAMVCLGSCRSIKHAGWVYCHCPDNKPARTLGPIFAHQIYVGTFTASVR